jgi:hypothetical protein
MNSRISAKCILTLLVGQRHEFLDKPFTALWVNAPFTNRPVGCKLPRAVRRDESPISDHFRNLLCVDPPQPAASPFKSPAS